MKTPLGDIEVDQTSDSYLAASFSIGQVWRDLDPTAAVALARSERLDLRKRYSEVADAERAVAKARDSLRSGAAP